MRNSILLVVGFAALGIHAAPVVATAGKVTFFSKTPMENIEATTTTAVSKLDVDARTISIRMRNTTFQFPNKLMQEHFNENFMESAKFPISGFDGVLKNFDTAALAAGNGVGIDAEGTLDVHGVKKPRTIRASIKKRPDGGYEGTARFAVKIFDHDIKIPTLVVAKIADSMQVTAEFRWSPEEVKK